MGGVQFYIQKDFLLNFFGQFPPMDSLEEGDWEKASQWRTFFDLLLRSDVQMDLRDDEILKFQAENPFFKKLFKKETGPPKPKPGLLHEVSKNDLHFLQNYCRTIFLLGEEQNSCSQLQENYGLLFFGADAELQKLVGLAEVEELTIQKGPFDGERWSFLAGFPFPSNSMVILDNYLFHKHYDQNLPPLLDRILPPQLSRSDFHLTIITTDDNGKINVERGFKFLEESLKQLARPYEIKVQVFVKKEFHDRELITNYLWIHSGYGFNLYSGRRFLQDTVLVFFPAGAKSGKKMTGFNSVTRSVSDMLFKFREVAEKAPKDGRMGAIKVAFGNISFQNRLFASLPKTNVNAF